MKRLFLYTLLFLLPAALNSQPVKVIVAETSPGVYEMQRNGQPYFIKGAGGATTSLHPELKARGGNSIRTWGTDASSKALLDGAQALGLTVSLGLWVGREKDGFNYNDPVAIANQLENFRNLVLSYKDHPALLAWGIGNEVDMEYTNLNVWNAINDISLMIHQIDGNHPTFTVTAGISTSKANAIAARAPDLDMLGVNAYAGITGVHSAILASDFKKPYLITEWGVNGPWEVSKTSWGAPLEPSSTAKAATIKQRYEQNILPHTGKCLGSYAFLWGFKTEGTKTWFGLFVNTETTEMTDVLHYEWTGNWPVNQAPKINALTLNNTTHEKSLVLPFSNKNQVTVSASDPDGDSLSYEFLVLPESGSTGVSPIPGATFDALPGIVTNPSGNTAALKFNDSHNLKNLRIYVLVRDGKGHIATASFPFRTEIIDLEERQWSFSPAQDAFVRGGIFKNTPYGTNDYKKLMVKTNASADSVWQTYIQFDLRDAPRYFGKGSLELYGSSPDSIEIELLSAGQASWVENDVTWNTKPSAYNPVLATEKVGPQTTWYSWNLTSYLSSQFESGVRSFTFVLRGKSISRGNPAIFSSKEAASGKPLMFFSTLSGMQNVHSGTLKVWPNPGHELFMVEFPMAHPTGSSLIIFNLQGKAVKTIGVPAGTGSVSFSLEEQPAGIYLLQHYTPEGQGMYSARLIKR
jgi:hypothetical protein